MLAAFIMVSLIASVSSGETGMRKGRGLPCLLVGRPFTTGVILDALHISERIC
jgi:hypothetical protein